MILALQLWIPLLLLVGFTLTQEPTKECSYKISLNKDEEYAISSPNFNYSSTYPTNIFCTWEITSISGIKRRIRFNFDVMSIWPTFNCFLDGIILFDGNSTEAPLLRKFCSINIPREVISTGPTVYIIFYTSEFIQKLYHGFLLRIQDIDPPVVCDNENEITCHNGKCVLKKLICDRKDDCGDGTDEELCDFSNRQHFTCGITPIHQVLGNDDRIVGGREAVPDSWPWQCSLRRRDLENGGHICGGVLINDQWIATAAHCFRNYHNVNSWSIYLGKYHKYSVDAKEQMRYSKRIIIHPQYFGNNFTAQLLQNSNLKDNDIALVELNAPITIAENVIPICLPPWHLKIPDGTICYVTGWGSTLGTGSSKVLKQAAVPIVSNEECRKFYFNIIDVTERMICAGYTEGGHDSCQGDSGGPLALENNGQWYLIGLVSTGKNCAQAKQPGIYTNVALFKWWIFSTIKY